MEYITVSLYVITHAAVFLAGAFAGFMAAFAVLIAIGKLASDIEKRAKADMARKV